MNAPTLPTAIQKKSTNIDASLYKHDAPKLLSCYS